MKKETLESVRKWAVERLTEAQIPEPLASVDILLSHVLKKERAYLYMNTSRDLDFSETNLFRMLIERRSAHEPLQYITGVQEFWSLSFQVESGVLIPRPETEILIECILNKIGLLSEVSIDILDIGCGSGVLSIILAREFKNANIMAVDISEKALEISMKNAKSHDVFQRIQYSKSDLFSDLLPQSFDLIVSNPPYIKETDWKKLPPQVRNYEPKKAFMGGHTGIDVHRKIIREAPSFLKSGGHLLMEISPEQSQDLLQEFQKYSCYSFAKVYSDYEKRERVILASYV